MYKQIAVNSQMTEKKLEEFGKRIHQLVQASSEGTPMIALIESYLKKIKKGFEALQNQFSEGMSWPDRSVHLLHIFNQFCDPEHRPAASLREHIGAFSTHLRMAETMSKFHCDWMAGDTKKGTLSLRQLLEDAIGLEWDDGQLERLSQSLWRRPLIAPDLGKVFGESTSSSSDSHLRTMDVDLLRGIRAYVDCLENKRQVGRIGETDRVLNDISVINMAIAPGPLSPEHRFHLSRLPLWLGKSDFSDQGHQLLSLLYDTFVPDGHEPSVGSRWAILVGKVMELRVNPRVLDECLPKGKMGAELDEELSRLKPDTLREAMCAFVKDIRQKAEDTSENTSMRWQIGEKRVSEAVPILLEAGTDGRTLSRVIALVNTWRSDMQPICSVGVDLQCLMFVEEIRQSLSAERLSKEELHAKVENRHFLQGAIIQHLQQSLREIPLSQEFASDVHHLNLAMRIIYEDHGLPVPEALGDPYEAGFQDRVVAQREKISRKFTDPSWMLMSMQSRIQEKGNPDLLISEVLSNLEAALIVQPDEDQDQRSRRFLEACFRTMDEASLIAFLFEKQGGNLEVLHGRLGGHGLLGLAALHSQEEVFGRLNDRLSPMIGPLEADQWGYSLLEYVVLGGLVSLGQEVSEICRQGADFGELLNRSASLSILPSLVALAAESKKPEMVDFALSLCGEVEQKKAMLTKRDETGHTALMRAAMTGNINCLGAVLGALEAVGLDVGGEINAANNEGQTPLMLTIGHGKSIPCIDMLLDKGADARAQIGDLSVADMVMMEDRIDLFAVFLGHPHVPDDVKSEIACELAYHGRPELGVLLTELSQEKAFLILGLVDPRDENVRTVAHYLSEYNPSVLNVLLKGPLKDRCFEVLNLKPEDPVVYSLMCYQKALLSSLLMDLSQDQVMEILIIETNNVFLPTAHLFFLYHFSTGLEDLLMSSLKDRVAEVLGIKNSQGESVAEYLVHSQEGKDRVVEMLKFENRNGGIAAQELAQDHENVLNTLLIDKLKDRAMEILKLIGPDGRSVAHILAKFRGNELGDILVTCSKDEAREILALQDSSGVLVSDELETTYGYVLESLTLFVAGNPDWMANYYL